MPGLFGIISTTQKEENEHLLRQMLESMHRESFYSSGTYIDAEAGLYIGWTCYKGSYFDCLPIINDKKNLTLF